MSDAQSMSMVERARLLLHETLRTLLPPGTRCALALYPDHWNSGDAAIWWGTREVLRELDVTVDYGCDSANYRADDLKRALPEGPILMAGGGNFGDVYRNEQELRLRILADHPGRPVIQLPQSTWFRGAEEIAVTAEAIGRHGSTTLLLRDVPSLAFAERHFPAPARLCPDMAMGLDLSGFPRRPDVQVMALWRNDQESTDPPPPLPPDSLHCDWLLGSRPIPPEEARHMSVAGLGFHRWIGNPSNSESSALRRRLAWRHMPWLWDQLAQDRTLRGCRLLTRGRITVTNRLHAHLLCMLMGQPHVVCDVSNRKVFSYRDTWFPPADASGHDATLVRFASSAAEASEQAQRLLASIARA